MRDKKRLFYLIFSASLQGGEAVSASDESFLLILIIRFLAPVLFVQLIKSFS
jgi:hypothetical protein